MRQKLIDLSRNSHKEWFNQLSNEDVSLLTSVGYECGAEHNFFKQEILNIADALRNRKLKKIPHIYKKFLDRYLDLVPDHIKCQADKNLIADDEYYRAWFFNRQMFIFDYLVAKDSFTKGRKRLSHVLWSPLLDIHTPESCYQFKDKVFHITDEQLERLATQHWSKPQRGCRCCLIGITAEKVNSYINSRAN